MVDCREVLCFEARYAETHGSVCHDSSLVIVVLDITLLVHGIHNTRDLDHCLGRLLPRRDEAVARFASHRCQMGPGMPVVNMENVSQNSDSFEDWHGYTPGIAHAVEA